VKWFKELTEWEGFQVNHCYLLDDSKSKMFAYAKFGQDEAKVFQEPIRISVRGRRFAAVPDRWRVKVAAEKPQGRVIEVQGSRGDVYRVTELDGVWTCTCSGFKFRGDCKHVKQVAQK
jgi:hypothetical protein